MKKIPTYEFPPDIGNSTRIECLLSSEFRSRVKNSVVSTFLLCLFFLSFNTVSFGQNANCALAAGEDGSFDNIAVGNSIFFEVPVYKDGGSLNLELTYNSDNSNNTDDRHIRVIIRETCGGPPLRQKNILPPTTNSNGTNSTTLNNVDLANWNCNETVIVELRNNGDIDVEVILTNINPEEACLSNLDLVLDNSNLNNNGVVCSSESAFNISTDNVVDAFGTNLCLKPVGSFSVSTSINGFTVPASTLTNNGDNTASFNPQNLLPGFYEVTFTYPCSNGLSYIKSTVLEVVSPPSAKLQDNAIFDCEAIGGDIALKNLLHADATIDGTFTYVSGPPGADNTILNPDGNARYEYTQSGCYRFEYTVDDPLNCAVISSDIIDVIIVLEPVIDALNLNGIESGCKTDAQTVTANAANAGSSSWEVFKNGTSVHTDSGNLSYNVAAPGQSEAVEYIICLTVTESYNYNCNSFSENGTCEQELCESFTVYNDGLDCDSNCEAPIAEVCDIETSPALVFECDFFEFEGPEVLSSSVNPNTGLIGCNDEDFDVQYQSEFLGFTPPSGGGKKIKDFPGIGTICSVFDFCICLPSPLPDFRPFGALYDALGCDKTISEFVFGIIAEIAGGDGGGVYLVADTDGDGAFDFVVEDGEAGNYPINETNTIPNRIDGTGDITVRMVSGWPNTPADVCGEVTPEGIDLIEKLPIGAIPIVGPTLESLLELGGCGLEVAFSSEETKIIKVINDEVPVFVNCPETSYIFSVDNSCDIEANWSIPIARDGCDLNVLDFKTDDSNSQGVRYITALSDIAPGDEKTVGEYTAVYEATGCNKKTTQCIINIVIDEGDPELVVPNDVVIPADADACDAVVMGLTPLSGLGCNTSLTYSTSGALSITGSDDISGNTFPLGTTTVEYEMQYVTETMQTITVEKDFTVTIVDEQRPVAECKTIQKQVDNTGNVIITALELDGGSSDNCTASNNLDYSITTNGIDFSAQITMDCFQKGFNFVTLKVDDEYGNSSTCIATIEIKGYFEEFVLNMDLPEICLEANNPEQFDFTNYLSITPQNSNVNLNHNDVSSLGGGVMGVFGISSFIPADGLPPVQGTGPNDPGDFGYIDPFTGVYTPGTGSGYVTVSYIMLIDGKTDQPGALIEGCYAIVHETFELRQPLVMDTPECECGDFTHRYVDLGVVEGGLEPYTLQYSGATLDLNDTGFNVTDATGTYTFSADNGHNINDFQEDLGTIRVDYTQPVWSITVVDARGCEIFRSGSCDNDDVTEAPTITCPDNIGVIYTDEYVCTNFEEWLHPDVLNGLLYDNCFVRQYNYYIENADGTVEGPFDLGPLVNIEDDGSTNIDPSLFEASHNFQKGVSTVFYYAADAVGNFIDCQFTVTVEDNLPPRFINCPYPPVVENSETDHCDAYVNFALPLAEDNCDVPTVTQIDNTGLTTGDRFPVGTTIMYWEAIDESDNRDTCQVKVIVNDYWNVPEIVCPDDVLQTTDDWRCDAEVYNIQPEISSICQDNLSVFYEIFSDAALTNRISCGVWDASGEKFDKGDSWVKYTVESQPLLLISEISQSAALDQLEIVNLGPASMEISCLEVVRTAADGAYTETLPMVTMLPSLAPTVLGVGEVMVFDFTADAPADMAACYLIQYMGAVIDQVAVNGYANACADFTGTLDSGDVYRHCEADTDAAADWVAAENCSPLTIGLLNPDLNAMPDNGTMTSLQSEPASSASCVFQVTIIDDEDPFCGELAPAPNNYVGPAINNISETTCNRSEIEIIDGCIIGLLDFNLSGNVTPANSTITLISPEGVEVEITTLPASPFDYYTFKSEGIWTLDIEPNAGVTGLEVTSWTLDITCMLPFTMDDVVLPNDPDLCGAQFDWTHPWFVDNCVEGTITVEYLSNDADCVPSGGQLADFGGQDVSEFFCVGTTTVLYTLVDEAGNDHQCSFDVTVEDVQDPVVVCPADISIQLDGGECRRAVCFEPLSATDNCEVVDTTYSIEPCTEFEIGITPVTITIFDEAGNSDECTFEIEIIEFVPDPYVMICNDLVNISLGSDCVEEIHADMILEGNNYHCYEDYIITISDVSGPIATSPSVTINDVGNTYTVMVYDPDSDNTCWGEITIEDYNIPQLECPADITISCLDSSDASFTGDAILTSCEASVEWITNDTWENYDNCDDVQSEITRIWTVVDESGNANNCVQTIQIERIQLTDIVFPSNHDGIDQPVINCVDLGNNPALSTPAFTGMPRAGAYDLNVGPNCGLSINVEDQEFNLCDGSYDIIRTWTVYDGCLPAVPGINPIAYSQVIKVVDNTAPALNCPADMTISVDDNNCMATFEVPAIGVEDACSSYEVITNTPNGSIFGNGGTINNIPKGTFDIKYQVQDNCNNISECEFKLTIVDGISPNMVCLEETEVALTTDGTAVTAYDVYDNGTYDNCCLDYIEVARMDENVFGETIAFNCNDSEVMVQLRAFDCAGNVNLCMVNVNVVDKINPIVTCPANQTINCDVYYSEYAPLLDEAFNNLENDPNLTQEEAYNFLQSAFGSVTTFDNCNITTTLQVSYEVNQCGEGSIFRTWNATDDAENAAIPCTQEISIEHHSDWTIDFPEDWSGELTAECEVPEIGYGEAVVSDDNCEMIAVSYTDEVFTVTADACYKVVRNWIAINWCTYDPAQSADYGNLLSLSDNIYQVTGDSYVTYTQTLDIYDTTAPEVTVIEDVNVGIIDGCTADFVLPTPEVLNECSGYEVFVTSADLESFGSEFNYADVIAGTYNVSYQIMDDCGNSSFESFKVIVSDEKAPTAFCTDELVIELMPDGNGGGMASIDAADFNFGSFDNCSADENLTYSFSTDPSETTANFDCSNTGGNEITMFVWDEAGNSDFCLVQLEVQDNNVACENTGSLTLSGSALTENDLAVENVIIDLNGGIQTTLSDDSGFYSFNDLSAGSDYSVVPSLDEDPLNGVSTFDIVLLTKHILGIQTLDSPYKMIAADANNSGTITTLDIVDVRKLILGINSNFTNNTSWRFVDADFVFTNPSNPFENGFPELVNFNNLDVDSEANFVAIKIADLNASFDPHNLNSVQGRNLNETLKINVKDEAVKSGEFVKLEFSTSAFIQGFQFTLDFNSDVLNFKGIEEGILTGANLGSSNNEEGIITFSWNDSKPVDFNGEELISIEFYALQDIQLSEVLNINSRLTIAEAYDASDAIMDVELIFDSSDQELNTVLYQNTPNPFKGNTNIGFSLAQTENVKLTIRDVNGKTIKLIEREFSKGYNSVEIDNIPNGVFYYTLEVDDFSMTKKMIKL
jgi:hypothetical protein